MYGTITSATCAIYNRTVTLSHANPQVAQVTLKAWDAFLSEVPKGMRIILDRLSPLLEMRKRKRILKETIKYVQERAN